MVGYMYHGKTVALLIPARNEALSLPGVLKAVPPEVDYVIVVDNGSSDATAEIAVSHGAWVVAEPRKGYGRACLAGLNAIRVNPPHIVVFADGDGSDDLSKLKDLLDPLVNEEADLVLTRRIPVEAGALSRQQYFGNWLATRLIRLIWGHNYADLGPMRAIKWKSLQDLGMSDPGCGWTVEMQIKALKCGLRVKELDHAYRPRSAGKSKISRTISGSMRAGSKILWVIGRELLERRRPLTAV